MAITRGELEGRILRLVNKTAANPGFYTRDKVSDSIEEALDFIAVEMAMAGEGWNNQMKFFSCVAGQITLPISADVGMINEVRYLFAGEYLPLRYDDANRRSQVQETAGLIQYPGSYRIVNNYIYFNPPLVEGGDQMIQLEYTTWPRRMQNQNDTLDGQFWKPFMHWVTYWAATRLVSGIGTALPDWAKQEAAWWSKIQEVIVKRNMQVTMIREFDGQ